MSTLAKVLLIILVCFIIWLATSGLCVFVLNWPAALVLRSAAISCIAMALGFIIIPRVP